jgi:hypothetical protein
MRAISASTVAGSVVNSRVAIVTAASTLPSANGSRCACAWMTGPRPVASASIAGSMSMPAASAPRRASAGRSRPVPSQRRRSAGRSGERARPGRPWPRSPRRSAPTSWRTTYRNPGRERPPGRRNPARRLPWEPPGRAAGRAQAACLAAGAAHDALAHAIPSAVDSIPGASFPDLVQVPRCGRVPRILIRQGTRPAGRSTPGSGRPCCRVIVVADGVARILAAVPADRFGRCAGPQ